MILAPGILLLFTGLLAMVLAVRIRENTWLSPYAFFGLLWSFIIGFSLITAPTYFFSFESLAFISLNIFVFFAGGYVTDHFFTPAKMKENRMITPSNKILSIHFIFSTLAGIVALFFLLSDAGMRFTELRSFQSFMEFSKVLTNQRYAGERLSQSTMLCLTICYSGCLTAGYFFVHGKTVIRKFASLIILLPLLLFTLVYTARAILIFALLFFLSAAITNYLILYKKKFVLFSRANIIALGLACLGLPAIFLFTQAIRMGISEVSVENAGIVLDHLKIYFSGNLSAFSYWFQEEMGKSALSMGAFTFAGVNEWIGGVPRELGIYGKAIDLDGHMNFSNIYTFFRFLIDDFGIAGTILFWFLLGIGCRLIYNKVLTGDRVAAGILSGVFTMLLFSFVTSVFAYNSVLIAWMFFVLVLYAADKYTDAERRSLAFDRKNESGYE